MGLVGVDSPHRNSQIGPTLDMFAQHRLIVHQIDVVASQHKHMVCILLQNEI